MEHLIERLTRRFLLGRATREEARFVVRHLLTQCPHCAALTRFILLGERSPRLISSEGGRPFSPPPFPGGATHE